MKRGITLIALIITIIVLVIMAGTSIAIIVGDNGIATKATKAKTETEVADVKSAAEIIRGEYEVNHGGENPSSEYIINKLIEKGTITRDQVEEYENDEGMGTVLVSGKRVTIVGRYTMSPIIDVNTLYLLRRNHTLSSYSIYGYNEEEWLEYDPINNNERLLYTNVKSMQYDDGYQAGYYLTMDNVLHMIEYNNFEINNVEKYQVNYNGGWAIDFDGKLYTWGCNDFGQLADGTHRNYSTNDPVCASDIPESEIYGKQIVYAEIGGFNGCAIDSNGDAYTWGYRQYKENDIINSYLPHCITKIADTEAYAKKIVYITMPSDGYTYMADDQGNIYIGTSIVGNANGKTIVEMSFTRDGKFCKDSEGTTYQFDYNSVTPISVDEEQIVINGSDANLRFDIYNGIFVQTQDGRNYYRKWMGK